MLLNNWIKSKTVPKEVLLTTFYCGASDNFKYVLLQKILSPCRCSTNYIFGDKGRYSWLPHDLLNLSIYKRKISTFFKCSIGETKDKIVFVLNNKVYIKPLSANTKIKGKKADIPSEYSILKTCINRVKETQKFKMLPADYTNDINNIELLQEILKLTSKEFNTPINTFNLEFNKDSSITIDVVGNGIMLPLQSINHIDNKFKLNYKNVNYIIYDCKHNFIEIR